MSYYEVGIGQLPVEGCDRHHDAGKPGDQELERRIKSLIRWNALAMVVRANQAAGELGRIWRLETSTGTWAVKEIFDPGSEAKAQADVAFQEAALAAGVPMPRPIRSSGGAVLTEVEAPGRRSMVRVYSWVDIAQPVRRAEATDAAAVLARLHALAIPDERPMDPWFREPVAADRWREILAATERAASSVKLPANTDSRCRMVRSSSCSRS